MRETASKLRTQIHQVWINEALNSELKHGSIKRLRQIAAIARSAQMTDEVVRRRNEVRSGQVKPVSADEVYRRIEHLLK